MRELTTPFPPATNQLGVEDSSDGNSLLDNSPRYRHHVPMALPEPKEQQMDTQVEQTAQAPEAPPARMLSAEERNDLRKKVLRGEDLTVEEAQSVYQTLRVGQGASVITGESTRKKRTKKEGYSDQALDKDLADLGL